MTNNDSKKALLEVEDLSINYETGTSLFRAVKNVNFKVEEGKTLSIVGESGSGKSTTASALIGLLPHATGNVNVKGYTIPAAPSFIKKGFNKWMASQMQFVFQDPFTSLNPKARVERILKEPFRTNNPFKQERNDAFYELLRQINLVLVKSLMLTNKEEEKRLIAIADKLNRDRTELIHDAKDEIDLDEYKIKNFKAEMWQAKKVMKTKLERFKENALVKLRAAKPEELESMIEINNNAYESYKEKLKAETDEAIEKFKTDRENAKIALAKAKAKRRNVKERLALERREFRDLINKYGNTDVEVRPLGFWEKNFNSENNENVVVPVESFKWEIKRRKEVRESDSKMDKVKAFKERLTNGSFLDDLLFKWIVSNITPIKSKDQGLEKKLETLINDFFDKFSFSELQNRIRHTIQDKLIEVGLDPKDIYKYPKDFSGGQRQRIAIARAMMVEPSLIIADEPISSLDVSIQAQIINLLKDLKKSHNLTLVFIAHDLRMVEYISDYIAVMSKGQIVEYGKTKEVFDNPTHPYTRSLLSSIPSIDTINLRLKVQEYNPGHYQDESRNLEEIFLSDTHKVLAEKQWVEQWKKEAKDFVVYEHQARHQVEGGTKEEVISIPNLARNQN